MTIDELTNKQWHIELADCIEHMATLPEDVFDMSVFSPPFPSLYAYTNEAGDIGNSENLKTDSKLHLSFFYKQLARVIKPGRAICVHVMQIPRLKRSGEVGLHDFRGTNIRIGERAGLVYEYDWAIRKNPQAQAIRTRSRELQFNGLETDRAKQRGTLLDYIIKFRVPGENAKPINEKGEVSRNNWIEWAEGCWSDIKATDTLNTKEAKGENDTKHICPLQLPVIRRLIKLFSDPNEIVFSPFAGIGSEGYEAIKAGRKFYGCELKTEYFETAKRNLAKAESACMETMQLFQEAV
jgi:DNA modification methylase